MLVWYPSSFAPWSSYGFKSLLEAFYLILSPANFQSKFLWGIAHT